MSQKIYILKKNKIMWGKKLDRKTNKQEDDKLVVNLDIIKEYASLHTKVLKLIRSKKLLMYSWLNN